MPRGSLPNYLGGSNLNSLLNYNINLMRMNRAEEAEQFQEDTRVVSLMADNYLKAKSRTLKMHISNSMRNFYQTVDPRLKPALQPFIAGSPLDEDVEKMEYFLTHYGEPPQRPVKQPDEEPRDFNNRMAEYYYGSYLWQRQRQKFFGVIPDNAPLEHSFPIGAEDGKMRYVVKMPDTPARIVDSDSLQLVKIADSEKRDIPSFLNNPISFSNHVTFNHGERKMFGAVEKNHLTGEEKMRVEDLGLVLEKGEAIKHIPRPTGLDTVKYMMMTNYDRDRANARLMLGSAKPDEATLAYSTLFDRARAIHETEKDPEKARQKIEYEMGKVYAGWVFQFTPKGKFDEDNPFGENSDIKEAPGIRIFITDRNNRVGGGTNNRLSFVYDRYNDTLYDNDFEPRREGGLSYFEQFFGSNFSEEKEGE